MNHATNKCMWLASICCEVYDSAIWEDLSGSKQMWRMTPITVEAHSYTIIFLFLIPSPSPPVSSLNSFVNYWMAFTVVHGVLRKLPEWCLHHSGPFSQSCNVITLGHLATWTEQCISPTLGCLASVDNLCIRLAQSHRERPGPFVTTYVLPCLALSHCCLSLIIK